MVAFSTKYMLRSILAALKRRRKKSPARETKTFWRKKGFPGLKTPFAKPFPAIQKLRATPEIATIYLEQVIKQNDWTLLPVGRHFCLWFYGRASAKEIWALDNRLTNQTKVPFVHVCFFLQPRPQGRPQGLLRGQNGGIHLHSILGVVTPLTNNMLLRSHMSYGSGTSIFPLISPCQCLCLQVILLLAWKISCRIWCNSYLHKLIWKI